MDFGRPNVEIGRKIANGQLLFLALWQFEEASSACVKFVWIWNPANMWLHTTLTLYSYDCLWYWVHC